MQFTVYTAAQSSATMSITLVLEFLGVWVSMLTMLCFQNPQKTAVSIAVYFPFKAKPVVLEEIRIFCVIIIVCTYVHSVYVYLGSHHVCNNGLYCLVFSL